MSRGQGRIIPKEFQGHFILRVQSIGAPEILLSFISPAVDPDTPQNQVGLEAVRQLVQYLLTYVRCLQALVVAPERLGKCDAQVHPVGMLGQYGAEIIDRPREQIAFEVQPSQSAGGERRFLQIDAVSPAIKSAQLFRDGFVVGRQLESAFQIPYSCV